MMSRTVQIFAAVALLAVATDAKLKPRECEVCIKVMNEVQTNIKAAGAKEGSDKVIEEYLLAFCKTVKPDSKDGRFCYYIGGSETSATGMMWLVSKPLSRFLPVEKACESVKKKDSAICDLQYPVEINLDTYDYKKARVKALKQILSDRFDDKCKGCTEKSDYIKKIQDYHAASKAGKSEL
jgi:hypothetical protein